LKTCIITTDTYLKHDTGQGHPERPDRVTAIIEHLKKIRSKNLVWKKPKKFDLKYLTLAHDKNYLNNIKDSFPKQGLNFLDGDTIVSPGSKEATRDAVGSILTAIDGVMKKDFNNAFCAVRPPGHHAEKQKAMGFCVYNNIAVGAYYLLEKYNLKKVAIIDFDVHHGNGTQDIFYDNEKVVGRATGGDFGFRVNKSIALGMVKPELATTGQKLKIYILVKCTTLQFWMRVLMIQKTNY